MKIMMMKMINFFVFLKKNLYIFKKKINNEDRKF